MVVAKVVGFTSVETRAKKDTGEAYEAMTVFFTYSDPNVTGAMCGRCWVKIDRASEDPMKNYTLWIKEGVMVLCEPNYKGEAQTLMPVDVLGDILTKS